MDTPLSRIPFSQQPLQETVFNGIIVVLAVVPIGLIFFATPQGGQGVGLTIYGFTLLAVCAATTLFGKWLHLKILKQTIDREKDEFLSFASHQLRTPLTTMRWRVEMLLSGDAGKINHTQRSFLDQVEQSTERMAGLVNQFLNVSRINLGTLAIRPEPCDIHGVLQSILEELSPLIKKKHLRIVRVFDKKIRSFSCDVRIARVLLFNIISNAVAYTPKGSITITTKKTASRVQITVADTGIGIPKKQQSSIFTKLFRADNTRGANQSGSGMGLYIVKTLCDQIGAQVSFISQENKGSVFTLELPLIKQRTSSGTKTLVTSSVS